MLSCTARDQTARDGPWRPTPRQLCPRHRFADVDVDIVPAEQLAQPLRKRWKHVLPRWTGRNASAGDNHLYHLSLAGLVPKS